MQITFILNGDSTTVDVQPGERLLRLLRRLGCYSGADTEYTAKWRKCALNARSWIA